MSFLQHVEGWFVTTEPKVQALILQIKEDVEIVASDIDAALKWIAGQTPAIAADLQFAETVAQQTGIVANPEVAAAVVAANLAVKGLNAFAAAETAGTSSAQSVLNGYVAVKQAQAAAAQASAAVTNVVT